MVKALIAVPTGFPIQDLGPLVTPFGVELRVVLDRVGAVVEIPPNVVQAVAAIGQFATVATGAIPNPGMLLLPPEALPWIEAWNRLFDPGFVAMLATRAAAWLTTPQPPCAHEMSGFGAPPSSPNQDTRMIGDIAVGLVFVGGPPGTPAEITLSDQLNMTLGVIQGFDIHFRNAPREARLVFLTDPLHVTLPVNPASVPPPIFTPPGGTPSAIPFEQYEQREAIWRDPALQSLGFPAGFAGINAYRSALLARPWPTGTPQRSIVMLITKYNTAHFAYAALGRLVIQFSNTVANTGIDNLDRVIAHETCHLFMAPDEYGACVPQQLFGPFSVPNGNCINSHIPFIPHTPCLMGGESDDMCAWSKAHVGWNPLPFRLPPII